MRHRQRIFRVANAAAEHRIDIHVKLGVLRQQLELLVQHLQALFGDVIRLHIVDADLQIFEARAIQPLDALGHQADIHW